MTHDVFSGSTFQLRSETEVITDVAPASKLQQRTRVSGDDDERRETAKRGFTLVVSGARRELYVNRLMERRFGYNWISLVRYCKYWQPGKLPTQ